MSADNYLALRKKGRWYVLYEGFASDGHEREIARCTNLEQAIDVAETRLRTEYYEYGLQLHTQTGPRGTT